MQDLLKQIYIIYYKIVYFFIIKRQIDNQIVFISEFEYTLDNIDYNLSNLIYQKKHFNPQQISILKQLTLIKQSKYIFCDNYYIYLLCCNLKNKVVVLSWHAGGAIKKIGFDSPEVKNSSLASQRRYQKVYNSYDYYLAASVHSQEVIKTAFKQKEDKVLMTGYPKIDLYYKNEFNQKVEEIKRKDEQKLIKLNIVYVPTFRSNIEDNYPQIELIEQLNAKFKDKYNIYYKLHPQIRNSKKIIKRLKKLEHSLEIADQDLEYYYKIADLLITDYSSALFEYYLFNQQVLFYHYDVDQYEQQKGLNFEFENYQQNIATNANEMIAKIETKNWDLKLDKKYELINQGTASRSAISKIFEQNIQSSLKKYMK